MDKRPPPTRVRTRHWYLDTEHQDFEALTTEAYRNTAPTNAVRALSADDQMCLVMYLKFYADNSANAGLREVKDELEKISEIMADAVRLAAKLESVFVGPYEVPPWALRYRFLPCSSSNWRTASKRSLTGMGSVGTRLR